MPLYQSKVFRRVVLFIIGIFIGYPLLMTTVNTVLTPINPVAIYLHKRFATPTEKFIALSIYGFSSFIAINEICAIVSFTIIFLLLLLQFLNDVIEILTVNSKKIMFPKKLFKLVVYYRYVMKFNNFSQ